MRIKIYEQVQGWYFVTTETPTQGRWLAARSFHTKTTYAKDAEDDDVSKISETSKSARLKITIKRLSGRVYFITLPNKSSNIF